MLVKLKPPVVHRWIVRRTVVMMQALLVEDLMKSGIDPAKLNLMLVQKLKIFIKDPTIDLSEKKVSRPRSLLFASRHKMPLASPINVNASWEDPVELSVHLAKPPVPSLARRVPQQPTLILPKESILEREYIPPSHDVPTPPLPNPPTFQGMAGRRMPISHPPQHSFGHSNLNFLSARPISHVSTSPKFRDTKENCQMTDELLAAIERTDKQQAQYRSVQSHPYPSAHGASPHSGVSNQPRDAFSSPSLQGRSRALTAQSVPHQSIPAVPTDNSSWKTPSDWITRLLPFPNPFQDIADGRMSPLPPQQSQSQSNITSHYAQPVPRVPTGPFLNKSQDVETWQMTKGLSADIESEGANKQQCQSVQSHSFPSVCNNSPSPRGPVVGILCQLTDKTSPNNPENGQRRLREQALACESLRTRERRPSSPSVASFTYSRLQSLTLEIKCPQLNILLFYRQSRTL